MKPLNVSIEKRVVLSVTIICIMQSFAFAQTDSPFYNPSFFILYFAASFVPFLYIVAVSGKCLKPSSESLMLAFSIMAYWFFEYIHSYGNLNIFSSIFFVLILPFCFLKNNLQIQAFSVFHKMLFWMSIYGILITVLYFFDIIPPFSVVDFYDNGDSDVLSYYANYILGYIQITDFGLMRFCGLFNEPGFFGTLAALTLIADRMIMSKENIVILVACMFTFSVACFVLIMVYLIMRGITTKNKNILIFLVLLFSIFVYLTTMEFESSNFAMFFQRFSFDGGDLVADNRTSYEFEKLWKQVLTNSDMLWFGYGQTLPNLGSSTYKIFILKHGLFGTIIIFFPFLLACYKLALRNKNCVMLVIVFVLSIYQRPQIFNMVYLVILFGGLHYLREIELKQI